MRNRRTWLKIFSSLLAVLMVLSAFCVTAFAEGSEEDEGVEILEWQNSLSLQNAIIHAKANPEKNYMLVIDKEAKLDKTALLPYNLTLSIQNCWFTIEEGGILRCYSGMDLENAHIMVRGVLELDGYAFFTNSAIQVDDCGSFEGNADLYVLRMDDAEIDDFPIDGFDGIDYDVETYDWGTCYMPRIQPLPEETTDYDPDPEPTPEEISREKPVSKKGINDLRRFWYRIRDNLDEILESFGTALFFLAIVVLSGIKKKKRAGAAQKKPAATGAASARPAAAGQNSPFKRETVSGSYHRSREAEIKNGARRPDPRMKTFTKPDAPCIVCDITGEDHFLRDRENRIKQLDEWLKNGLIDKTEYRILKQRYERDQ